MPSPPARRARRGPVGPLVGEQEQRAADLGFLVNIGAELEFFLFKDSYAEAAEKRYHGLVPHSDVVEDYHILQTTRDEYIIRDIRNGLQAAGVPVEFSKGEAGKGQHEINLDYTTAVIVVGVLMVIYVTFGGMIATTWVQIIKACLMLFGGTVLLFLSMSQFGFSLEEVAKKAVEVHKDGIKIMGPGSLMADPVTAVSLSLGLVFGTAGLPHIMMRFFTVPNAKEARKSVFVASGCIGFSGEFDRVYAAAPSALTLHDGPHGLQIAQSASFADTVIWNPGAELCGRLGDMPPDGFTRMLCVEAAQVMTPVEVAAGQTWQGWQRLTVL